MLSRNEVEPQMGSREALISEAESQGIHPLSIWLLVSHIRPAEGVVLFDSVPSVSGRDSCPGRHWAVCSCLESLTSESEIQIIELDREGRPNGNEPEIVKASQRRFTGALIDSPRYGKNYYALGDKDCLYISGSYIDPLK